jgi:hypothetical protein
MNNEGAQSKMLEHLHEHLHFLLKSYSYREDAQHAQHAQRYRQQI